MGDQFLRQVAPGAFVAEALPMFAQHFADLDGDGHLDGVLGTAVYLQNTLGGFDAVPIAVPIGVADVVDLDQDGLVDVSPYWSRTPSRGSSQEIARATTSSWSTRSASSR